MKVPPAVAIPVWWIPNLLALDAPLVAVVWQRFLGATLGSPVPWRVSLILALIVWAIYLLDRVLDGEHTPPSTPRHRLAHRFRRLFLALAVLAAILAGFLTLALPRAYWICGLAVALGVGCYLAAVHLLARQHRLFSGWKELLVGIGFAAGVAIPLMANQTAPLRWLPSVIALAGLCGVNCLLIERWEARPASRGFLPLGMGLATLILALALPMPIGVAIAGSLAGLLGVHLLLRQHTQLARVLADGVLLSPLLLLPWGSP